MGCGHGCSARPVPDLFCWAGTHLHSFYARGFHVCSWSGLSWDLPMAVGRPDASRPGDERLDPMPAAVQPVVIVLRVVMALCGTWSRPTLAQVWKASPCPQERPTRVPVRWGTQMMLVRPGDC